jgi:hypothetical protein
MIFFLLGIACLSLCKNCSDLLLQEVLRKSLSSVKEKRLAAVIEKTVDDACFHQTLQSKHQTFVNRWAHLNTSPFSFQSFSLWV